MLLSDLLVFLSYGSSLQGQVNHFSFTGGSPVLHPGILSAALLAEHWL